MTTLLILFLSFVVGALAVCTIRGSLRRLCEGKAIRREFDEWQKRGGK